MQQWFYLAIIDLQRQGVEQGDMSHLKTDWLCVATEGDTVDGRIIERQWIIDMGETYDYNHYVALIWPEHQKGGVISVKYWKPPGGTGMTDWRGCMSVFARICG